MSTPRNIPSPETSPETSFGKWNSNTDSFETKTRDTEERKTEERDIRNPFPEQAPMKKEVVVSKENNSTKPKPAVAAKPKPAVAAKPKPAVAAKPKPLVQTKAGAVEAEGMFGHSKEGHSKQPLSVQEELEKKIAERSKRKNITGGK